MPLTQAYRGQSRKLVVAIDLGTTYSGIAYSILDPGSIPEIRSVQEYPGQEGEGRSADSKIPSLLYYTAEGSLYAAGAEAALMAEQMEEQGRGEEFELIKWFKLRLRPSSMAMDDSNVLNFPTFKQPVEMWGDFLGYLYRCATAYISKVHGEETMRSFRRNIDIILSHPNGWAGAEQKSIRKAAVIGGLISDTQEDHARVKFVTEGEASFHYCVMSGLSPETLEVDHGLMIVDAGGGTVDFSTYKITNIAPVAAEEIVASECTFQGSSFINMRAERFLREKLRGSRYGDEANLKVILDEFERSAKPSFKDSTTTSLVKFGGLRDNDPRFGITRGRLSLSAADLISFFEPSITSIEDNIKKQMDKARGPVSTLLLVGGYAKSPYLYSRLEEITRRLNLQLYCPRTSDPSKAAAAGGISFYLQHSVSARVAAITYGSKCGREINILDPAHRRRLGNIGLAPSGRPICVGGFATILPKGTLVPENRSFEELFIMERKNLSDLNSLSSDVTGYRGSLERPEWTDEEPDMFYTLCTVRADTSTVPKTPLTGRNGVYYRLDVKIILYPGLTELEAKLAWTENGVQKEGPATVVYDRTTG